MNQAPVGMLFTSVFGKLEGIFGNRSFPKQPGLKATWARLVRGKSHATASVKGHVWGGGMSSL